MIRSLLKAANPKKKPQARWNGWRKREGRKKAKKKASSKVRRLRACPPFLSGSPLPWAVRRFSCDGGREGGQAAAAPRSQRLCRAWTFQAVLVARRGALPWRQELLLGMFCIPLPGSGQVASSKKEGTAASKKKRGGRERERTRGGKEHFIIKVLWGRHFY